MSGDKELDFIHIRDTDGRLSHFNVYGNAEDNDCMIVSGNLPHNTAFKPESIEDAERWILWLKSYIYNEAANSEVSYAEYQEAIKRSINASFGVSGFPRHVTIKKDEKK